MGIRVAYEPTTLCHISRNERATPEDDDSPDRHIEATIQGWRSLAMPLIEPVVDSVTGNILNPWNPKPDTGYEIPTLGGVVGSAVGGGVDGGEGDDSDSDLENDGFYSSYRQCSALGGHATDDNTGINES